MEKRAPYEYKIVNLSKLISGSMGFVFQWYLLVAISCDLYLNRTQNLDMC